MRTAIILSLMLHILMFARTEMLSREVKKSTAYINGFIHGFEEVTKILDEGLHRMTEDKKHEI